MNNCSTYCIYIYALIYYSQINSQYIFYINTINYCYTINKQLWSYCKAVISAVEEQRKKTTELTCCATDKHSQATMLKKQIKKLDPMILCQRDALSPQTESTTM